MKKNIPVRANPATSAPLSQDSRCRGIVTGRLRWNPLIYPCVDGSKNCLFQLDVIYRSGTRDLQQPENSARLDVHVPPQDVGSSPYLKLRQGQLVTVEYELIQSVYQNADHEAVSKTKLMARRLALHSESKQSGPRNSNRPAMRTHRPAGAPAPERARPSAVSNYPGRWSGADCRRREEVSV